MMPDEYRIHGSVRLNRLTRVVDLRGTGGWTPRQIVEVQDPIVFELRFAEPLRPGYELQVSALTEGGVGIVSVVVTDTLPTGFTVTLVGAEGTLPEVVGFSFEVTGQTEAEVPDDRRVPVEEAVRDLNALAAVLAHEAAFGHVCLVGSASIEPRATMEARLARQDEVVGRLEQALIRTATSQREPIERALKLARARHERMHKLLGAARYWDSALEFGRLWGEYCAEYQRRALGGKHIPLCTGGGPGLMRAAALGARERGAQVIGIDAVFSNDERFKPGCPGCESALHHSVTASVRLVCNDLAVRQAALLNGAHVVLFWPGGFGSCWQVFQTLTRLQTSHLRRWRTRAVFVHGEFWRPLFDAIARFRELGAVNSHGDRILIPGVDDDPDDRKDGAFVAEVVDSAQAAFAVTRDFVEALARENQLSRR